MSVPFTSGFRSLTNFSLETVLRWYLSPHLETRLAPLHRPFRPACVKSQRDSTEQRLVGFISKKNFLKQIGSVFRKGLYFLFIRGPLIDEICLKKRAYDQTCEIIDRFCFSIRFSFIFGTLLYRCIEKQLAHILEYKYEILQIDCDLAKTYPFEKPLKILISGATGFVGNALRLFLESVGHDVWSLTRSFQGIDGKRIGWNFLLRGVKEFDAVIHLAGENISKGWWTHRKKKLILESRQKSTFQLVQALGKLKSPPQTLISASGVGVYGDCGDEVLTERSARKKPLFLTKVCELWEGATHQLAEQGRVRVVCARFGMVLSPKGGALKKMLIPFKMGVGGRIGSGRQYVSWIAIEDVVGALYHVLMTPSLFGPVNFTSPYPVRNKQFAREIEKAIGCFPRAPIPSCVVQLLFGQKGRELFLASACAQPKKLLDSGYCFRFALLREVLQWLM